MSDPSDENNDEAEFVPPFTPWLTDPDGKPLDFIPMSLRRILDDRDDEDDA